MTATPGATTADVVWTDNDDTAWNLRYRLINPNEMKYFLWDFETDESRENWEIYDLDGDGNNWYAAARYDIAHGGSILFMSNSYDSNTSDPLDPDNWLISPQVPLDGTLSVWAASYHNSDLDNFAVYVLNGSYDSGNFNVNDWVKVGEDHQPTCFDVNEGGWKQYTFDLSEFAGNTGHFAIRHYNSSNNWRLMIDDVSLTVPGDPPAEWNVVEGINTTNYTILGLTPGENYEVQVQAYNRKGTSDWTKSFFFSTENGAIDVTLHDNEDNSNVITAFNEQFVNVSISGRKLYKDGGWNTLCLPFDFYIDGSVLENANIKVLNG